MKFSTQAIHAGQTPDPSTGAVMTPVYFTSTYVQEGLGQHKGFEYGRRETFGVTEFRWCHDFQADTYTYLNDSADYYRSIHVPPCKNRTRMGDRRHNWCFRCPAGFPDVLLDAKDAAEHRDRLIV